MKLQVPDLSPESNNNSYAMAKAYINLNLPVD